VRSPLSTADFLARAVFFAGAPFAIVPMTTLFPVYGALYGVFAMLVVFAFGEAVSARAESSVVLRWVLRRELRAQAFYLEHSPKPFAYYVFYPLLFPYWLTNKQARQEFWLFKGYTLVSFGVMLASIYHQYRTNWRPELTFDDYLPIIGLTLGVETVLVLSLLMPMATTVIALEKERKRWRLALLLFLSAVSTTIVLVGISRKRDPIVSVATRERVRLRNQRDTKRAHEVRVEAARAAMRNLMIDQSQFEGDGKVLGEPLETTRVALEHFYKRDETYAFDLWASPRSKPEVLVLYIEKSRKGAPLWTAVNRKGEEIKDPAKLPKGAFRAMRLAADLSSPQPAAGPARARALGVFAALWREGRREGVRGLRRLREGGARAQGVVGRRRDEDPWARRDVRRTGRDVAAFRRSDRLHGGRLRWRRKTKATCLSLPRRQRVDGSEAARW
jgi:hypothetical protein